jgi:hypothetical protein
MAKLIETLKARFEEHPARHPGIEWPDVRGRLEAHPKKLASLEKMEKTGGEPDVVGFENGQFVFFDCSAESPEGRRSFCFDAAALKARKVAKPKNSAMAAAAKMGAELLTEEQYRFLQTLGEFDRKTQSWIQTPPKIRALGGALFCDRRFDTVFTYHNGADAYFAGRGFRAVLRV